MGDCAFDVEMLKFDVSGLEHMTITVPGQDPLSWAAIDVNRII